MNSIKAIRVTLIIAAIYACLTLPLVAFLVLDEAIQQRVYMHIAAHFGEHDIAFIGDSHTAGGYTWANKIGVYNFNICNYGQGGFKTDQVMYYAIRVAKEKFKFCFIMSGANDELTSNAVVEKSFNHYMKIIKLLKDANVEPVIELVLYKENEKWAKYIDQYNKRIAAYCIANNITVIDLNKLLSDESGLKKEYSRDGAHLNDKAYRIWGKEIERVLHEKKYL